MIQAFKIGKPKNSKNILFFLFSYYIYRRYGYVNSAAEKHNENEMKSLSDAMSFFTKQFQEKAGVDWKERNDYALHEGSYELVEWKTPLMGTYGNISSASDD